MEAEAGLEPQHSSTNESKPTNKYCAPKSKGCPTRTLPTPPTPPAANEWTLVIQEGVVLGVSAAAAVAHQKMNHPTIRTALTVAGYQIFRRCTMAVVVKLENTLWYAVIDGLLGGLERKCCVGRSFEKPKPFGLML